jgi:hypothetical protein
MNRCQYFVVPHADKWKVDCGDRHIGPYESQSKAIRAAVDTANQQSLAGQPAQVLVQDDAHRFRTEWTFGEDPYPPKDTAQQG